MTSTAVVHNVHTANISGGSFHITQEYYNGRENTYTLKELSTETVPDAVHNAKGLDDTGCYPGTRKDILNDLSHWVDSLRDRRPFYFLSAPMGSGKTAIAKTLANQYSSKSSLLSTFFFSRTIEKRNTANHLIPTIAYQVATKLPVVAEFILEAVTRDPTIFFQSLRIQMRTLLLDPLKRACANVLATERRNWPHLLVIDGIDECIERSVQVRILEVLAEFSQSVPYPCATLISCRPELHLLNAFETEPLRELSIHVYLPLKYDSKNDIRHFLELSFKAIRRAHQKLVDFPVDWPGEAVITTLVKKSSGHFIYPATVVKYVGALDDDPLHRLDVVRGVVVNQPDDENPFAQLDALYTGIIASIKPKHLPNIVTALSFALASSHSTDFALVEAGIRVNLASLQNILIRVDQFGDKLEINFLHASLADYLLSRRRSGQYYIGWQEAHTNVAIYLFDHHIMAESNVGLQATASFAHHLPKAALTDSLQSRMRRFRDPRIVSRPIHGCIGVEGRVAIWETLQLLVDETMIRASPDLTSTPESHPEDTVEGSDHLDDLHVREVLSGLKHTTKDQEERSVQALAQHTAFIRIIGPIIVASDSCDFTFPALFSLWIKGQISTLRFARQTILPATTREMVRTAVCINAWKCSTEVIRYSNGVFDREQLQKGVWPWSPSKDKTENKHFARDTFLGYLIPLTRIAGPSSKLLMHLRTMEHLIYYVCHDKYGKSLGEEEARAWDAVQKYISVNSETFSQRRDREAGIIFFWSVFYLLINFNSYGWTWKFLAVSILTHIHTYIIFCRFTLPFINYEFGLGSGV